MHFNAPHGRKIKCRWGEKGVYYFKCRGVYLLCKSFLYLSITYKLWVSKSTHQFLLCNTFNQWILQLQRLALDKCTNWGFDNTKQRVCCNGSWQRKINRTVCCFWISDFMFINFCWLTASSKSMVTPPPPPTLQVSCYCESKNLWTLLLDFVYLLLPINLYFIFTGLEK